ncbi:MAG: N-acetylmuramoyl-L-alanine amidase [Corynebacterium glucuronolyticum]|nr:N-acetylmuramoyl-L-alanine amidase [Mycobacteriaceae bacterium]MDY5835121.1 N-acetylmuramoyl-L-alanine amidase [Corynebacterium glucuronolyticum]
MKNWFSLEPDKYNLLTTHFTPGRAGHTIKHVTLHHMAMVGGVDECVRVWRDRPASGHYCVGPDGVIGQAVNDWDTAWGNANLLSNQETIVVEHSNCGGAAQDWPISDATLEEGAHLVAALHHGYHLGRPRPGVTIRYHCIESGGLTSCPYHLRPGHKYNARYIERVFYWYDEMARIRDEVEASGGSVFDTPHDKAEKIDKKELDMALFGPEQVGALNEAKLSAASADAKLDVVRAELTEPFPSLINSAKAFDAITYLRLIDAATWEARQLMDAVARKVGLDPTEVVAAARARDNGGEA